MRALREGTDGRRVGAGDLRILWLDRGGAADLLRIGRLACASRDGGASDRGRSPVDPGRCRQALRGGRGGRDLHRRDVLAQFHLSQGCRSEEHTSELQSLMRISYAVFCLKTKKL